jgi:hypothetical protein
VARAGTRGTPADNVPGSVMADAPTVAIRMPRQP